MRMRWKRALARLSSESGSHDSADTCVSRKLLLLSIMALRGNGKRRIDFTLGATKRQADLEGE